MTTNVLPILEYGNPNSHLRDVSKSVEIPYSQMAKGSIEIMLATCKHNKNLIGLSAPQLGWAFRIILVHIKPTEYRPELIQDEPLIMVNPVVTPVLYSSELGYEGCGSLPGIFAKVVRASKIHVEYLNSTGERQEMRAEGLKARVIQHEVDHLDGINFLERADLKTVITTSQYKRIQEEERNSFP